MGFEYKIIANFTDIELSQIKELLLNKKEFQKRYLYNDKEFWDFKSDDNKGDMPNISICFEHDGIYICRYDISCLWENLEELKAYIEAKYIKYTVKDFQE